MSYLLTPNGRKQVVSESMSDTLKDFDKRHKEHQKIKKALHTHISDLHHLGKIYQHSDKIHDSHIGSELEDNMHSHMQSKITDIESHLDKHPIDNDTYNHIKKYAAASPLARIN